MKRSVKFSHLIGKAFVRGGSNWREDGGLDCEGVAATICREAGIPRDAHGFPFAPGMGDTSCGSTRAKPSIPLSTLWEAVGNDLAAANQLFDVVLSISSLNAKKREYHVDIVVNEKGPALLTAAAGRGVFKRAADMVLAERIICVYRLPKRFLPGGAA